MHSFRGRIFDFKVLAALKISVLCSLVTYSQGVLRCSWFENKEHISDIRLSSSKMFFRWCDFTQDVVFFGFLLKLFQAYAGYALYRMFFSLFLACLEELKESLIFPKFLVLIPVALQSYHKTKYR